MLMMRLLLRINRMLRMLHLMLSHLSMLQSLILRRIQRTMTTRTLRRILLIISPMEEMTAMTRRGHQRMMRMMIWIEADEEEEEEHPASADSIVVASTAADQAPSTKETEPFETDESAATPPPHPAYRMTAKISIPAPVPVPAWSDSEVVRLLAMYSPPASLLSPWSSPPSWIPFPPLPPILSPPSHAASTSSPRLQPPSASRREDRPEVTLLPQKRLGIALGPRYEVGESSSAAAARTARGLRADYGFVATMDREIMRDPGRDVDASDLVRGDVMALRTTVLVKRLKRSRIPLVKVRWNSKRGPEFTWEREDQFRKKYPHLFAKSAPSSNVTS
nr:putative reverse transcriptase domain-containing protein [Tanacetum cinerariifolium]